ncbi:sarcosine oxidase subunit gamma [Faunimonas sp. B44]|uniref:sarcosine oxidase subunit gamma n=1 Tax=Faunimonas sp. B44 TaxID=3461493 RepID=UPI0040451757
MTKGRPIPVRRSPLHHRRAIEATAGAVRMCERRFLGKYILRADGGTAGPLLHTALGLDLPLEPLASSVAGDTAWLWMGPDEWMLVTAPGDGFERAEAARAALDGERHQLTDVGDYYTAIEVAGPRSRDLLMKLTTLDLHPRTFAAGMVAGSMFGRVNALLWLKGDGLAAGPVFQLFIRWSHADYLWCVLAACGREWGMPQEVPVKGETLVVG